MKRANGLKQEMISLYVTFVIFLITFPKFVPEYGVGLDPSLATQFINTIPPTQEVEYAGDRKLERKIKSFIRS